MKSSLTAHNVKCNHDKVTFTTQPAHPRYDLPRELIFNFYGYIRMSTSDTPQHLRYPQSQQLFAPEGSHTREYHFRLRKRIKGSAAARPSYSLFNSALLRVQKFEIPTPDLQTTNLELKPKPKLKHKSTALNYTHHQYRK